MPASELTFTLAQINPTVGALEANTNMVEEIWSASKADLVVFPELVICGYPPEDLVLKDAFIHDIEAIIERLCAASKNYEAAALVSVPWYLNGLLKNTVLLIDNGEVIAKQGKYHLPNYGVFDEKRVFSPGLLPKPITFRGCKLGILICEDMWFENIAAHQKLEGAEVLISVNASPYTIDKQNQRLSHAANRVKETGLPMVCVNQIGGQDELVFDGVSFALNKNAEYIYKAPAFVSDITDISLKDAVTLPGKCNENEDIYEALKLGVHDYITKNNFPGILIGLSGGVDSALAAAIACDAIGADKVHCVMMPSPFTSQDSFNDAAELAENLGCTYEIINIEQAMQAFERSIANLTGTAHENMQSRTRGLILMSLSNMNGKMVLSTGNKSEMAVGYATLYGDMCGGFNPLKDVYKTRVYKLCEWRNSKNKLIPERIISKEPTAELKDNQRDQDSLPEYETLDDILQSLIEEHLSVNEIVAKGHAEETVKRVWRMLDIAEYKRRQAPPGVVITQKSFGRDRRYPITNGYK